MSNEIPDEPVMTAAKVIAVQGLLVDFFALEAVRSSFWCLRESPIISRQLKLHVAWRSSSAGRNALTTFAARELRPIPFEILARRGLAHHAALDGPPGGAGHFDGGGAS
jgi:predicted anti-sigma-YlaC factor YlaD